MNRRVAKAIVYGTTGCIVLSLMASIVAMFWVYMGAAGVAVFAAIIVWLVVMIVAADSLEQHEGDE